MFSYDDLFQIGVIGLMAAVENYDADKGSLSNCAIQIIKRHIYVAYKKELSHYKAELKKEDSPAYTTDTYNDYREFAEVVMSRAQKVGALKDNKVSIGLKALVYIVQG